MLLCFEPNYLSNWCAKSDAFFQLNLSLDSCMITLKRRNTKSMSFLPFKICFYMPSGGLVRRVRLNPQERQVVPEAVTVKQKGEPKVLQMVHGIRIIIWIQTHSGWTNSLWERSLAWVHPVMKLKFATHQGYLYLSIWNRNNHTFANLWQIRQAKFLGVCSI